MSLEVWIALVALFGVGGLTPGPAVMLVLASAFRYGFKPAMLAALGIATANIGWLLMAASGAAVLATNFPAAFLAMKFIGLAVILFLALSAMFGPLPDANAQDNSAPPRAKLYGKGLALQISSPMPLVFFGLLLPTYFDSSASLIIQLTIMFVTVTVTELLGLAFYAYSAQRMRELLSSPKAARLFNIFIGIVMICSGIWAILSTSGH